jgi:asparagine synthetase B (glutamine-hydrolysing)
MNQHWPWPVLNFWLPAYRRLAEEASRRGCRVIFTGTGGDEWLTVGPMYGADLLRRLKLGAYFKFWGALGRSHRLSNYELLRSMWKYGPRVLIGAGARRVVGAVAPDLLSGRLHRLYQRAIPDWVAPDPDLRQEIGHRVDPRDRELSRSPLAYYLSQGRRPLEHPIISMEMEERFEAGRRIGVIELHPYWDPDVVDLLYRTPPELLMAQGRNKGLVRLMMAERFPELGFERKKKVNSIDYFRSTVLREGRRAWESIGGVQSLATLGVVDGLMVGSMIDGILARGDMKQAHLIWELLGLEVWARNRT